MKITKAQFDSFWDKKGKTFDFKINNPSRLKENIGDKITSYYHDSADLDYYVCHMRNSNESTRKIVVEFYKYLETDCGCGHVESDLYDKRLFDYPFERQLEIAKFLHRPRTVKEIEEEFSVGEKTIRADILALEDGITVLGAKIRITKIKDKKKYYYKSTFHPIFLPLNLTEVYALTDYLEKVLPSSDMSAQVLRELSQRVKSQLSDYAFEKLFPNEERILTENEYVADEEFSNGEGRRMYLLKSGAKCKFYCNNEEIYGHFDIDDNGKYFIRLLDGSILDADINSIEYVIVDEYK